MAEKSNIQHLRDILKEIEKDDIGEEARNKKFEEAFEFIDAMEEELKDAKEKESELEKELESANSEILLEYNEENLGLDTFYWKLKNGNLKLEGEVESFVQRLKRTYIGVTA